ncbi:DHS-like NAD/FAD-binding domain-containing protein [Pholiota conissans]|uniref:NAD-dependent protein deacylase n=1 Tax=Pholiota conissans TaxID=109636 RepID=A0A9P6CZM4_9AGAR|nr:DHS-like NAD/FAD-binding domain-containing protein [Pholiota conissans]
MPFQDLLRKSTNIIVVAGAGLSAASGTRERLTTKYRIPTFRGSGGLWRKYNAVSLATPEGFQASPSLVWQFYHYRREIARRAKPNDAHRVLSAFGLSYFRNQIAPQSTFTLITQNIDGLSARSDQEIAANNPEAANASDKAEIIEMHGRLFDVKCSNRKCGHVEFNTTSPICQALSGTEELLEMGQGTVEPEIDPSKLPRCSKCGSLARPGVVWFGERPQRMRDIDELVQKADLCLVIGTSSTVQPAASYAYEVQDQGGKVAVFNLENTPGDDEADFLFLGSCEELLPKALGLRVSEDGRITVDKQAAKD